MTEGKGGMALNLARAQGMYNVVTGVWPLLSMRSFEAVLGPKVDRWLVRTVSGLLLGIGIAQASTDRAALPVVRRLSAMTAGTLLAVDATYALRGRIAKTYLLDAVVEAGWLAAWLRSGPVRTRAVRPGPAGARRAKR
jgi:hypothetical protein